MAAELQKTKGLRVRRHLAKLYEAAAESAGQSFSEWARNRLRRAAIRELDQDARDESTDA